MTPLAEWAFVVYLAGDNNLSDAGDQDLAEMRSLGATDEVNIVVEFDNAGNAASLSSHLSCAHRRKLLNGIPRQAGGEERLRQRRPLDRDILHRTLCTGGH